MAAEDHCSARRQCGCLWSRFGHLNCSNEKPPHILYILASHRHNTVFLLFRFFSPFALKYWLQCWTSRGVFFIVNQYWSIGSPGVEYGSISHQAVEEIWFQLARGARSRFPSSGNSRHGNISQMDWYRLARTFLATEPAQGNFCHISLTQLGQAVKKKKKKRGGVEYLADPRWRALVKHWINIPLLAWILCYFFKEWKGAKQSNRNGGCSSALGAAYTLWSCSVLGLLVRIMPRSACKSYCKLFLIYWTNVPENTGECGNIFIALIIWLIFMNSAHLLNLNRATNYMI